MTVQHESRVVETLHRRGVSRPGIDRILTFRRQRRGGCHRDSQLAVLAIINKVRIGTIVSVGIASASGVAIEMPQRPVEGFVGNIRATFLGQHQKSDHVRSRRIEVTTTVTSQGTPPPGPGIVVLRLRRAIDPGLNVSEDFRISGF